MRRCLLLAAALIGMLTAAAFAAEGQQANYKMTMTISADLITNALGVAGVKTTKDKQGKPPPKFTIPPVILSGKTIWSGGRSRNETKGSKDKSATVSITDLSHKVGYLLDAATKTAWKGDFSSNPALAGLADRSVGQGGASMLMDYPTAFKQLETMEGVTVTALPPKKVNGYNCHGLSYTMDLSKLKNKLGGSASGVKDGTPSMMDTVLKSMGTATGQMWFSDQHKVVVKVLTKTTGMSMVMEFTDVKPWSGPDSAFAVPKGYAVKDVSQRSYNQPKPGAPKPSKN
jgi:hypothetical protein